MRKKLTNFLNTEMKSYKFRLLSSLVLSKWFHKLKNMNKPRTKHPVPYSLNTTKKKNSSSESKSLTHSSSSHFSNRLNTSLQSKTLQISPRNSLHMIQSRRKCVYKPSPPSSSSLSTGFNKNRIKFLQRQDSTSASAYNIISRDFKKNMLKETKMLDSLKKACPASKLTEGTLITHNLSVKVNNKEKEEDACRIQKKLQKTLVSSGRRSSANSPGMKLRITSPRVQVSPRRSKSGLQNKQVLDSFAVIKSSLDPKKDFRESMVEMIKENNIKASKDLEDLLACYLSLNHKEYHDLIIKVFIQVWLEVIQSTFASK